MFGQLGAVNKKLEDWIDANLTPMTMYKRCLAAYGKVWSNIDDLDKPINSEPALEATGRLFTRRLLKGLPVYIDAADPELSELLDELEAAIEKLEECIKPAKGPGAQTRNADSSTKDLDEQTVKRNASRLDVKQGATIRHGGWKTWPWRISRMFTRS
ncbi:hypothetical protein J4E85_002374 [Alternaria conjuncta]|uniref:uncharacterized protein n=1 Tax=Alternaria conjuncta TaxID=181017 RepID=UPI0022206E0E|nr:uncharacterized protein J4E85_002374 [Alternaria conjuncta]KAI4934517.1 hypothetical protein J4E85_002374 [Alternaria conjuncta]